MYLVQRIFLFLHLIGTCFFSVDYLNININTLLV